MTGRGVDAFEVLGLPYDPDLSDGEVRAAYRLRLRATHPDNGGDVACAAAVTAAYAALRSSVRRAELLEAVWPDVLAWGELAGPVARPVGVVGLERAGAPPRGRGGGPAPDAERRAELELEVAESRRRQGLPPYITDEATLEKIADLLVTVLGRDAGVRERAGPPAGVVPRPLAGVREYAPAASGAVGVGWWRRGWLRVRYGRPGVLAARVVAAALVPVAAYVAAPGYPAWPALGLGAVVWLVLTGRWDLAPVARR